MPVEFTARDERTMQVPVPCEGPDLDAFGALFTRAITDGYTLAGAQTLQGGSQRDPYTVGLKLTFSKEPR
jgi:hypothetical protein